MKGHVIAFLLAVTATACSGARGETPETARGTTGQGGVLDISHGWKFRTGDDPEWSKPSYDDSAWADIELGKPGERLGDADYDGYAWYRARLHVPAHFKDSADFRQCRRLLLTLGWINAVDQTWFNGKSIAGPTKGNALAHHDRCRPEEAEVLSDVRVAGAGFLYSRLYLQER